MDTKYVKILKTNLVWLGVLIFMMTSCCEYCGNSTPTSCFPDVSSDKLGICVSNEKIQCPTDFEDCFINIGEFYHIWRPLLEPTLDPLTTSYDTFIVHDILISGIFVNPGGGGDGGLPACSLPPIPTGSGNTMIIPKEMPVLYASLGSVEESDVSIPNQEILLFNYEKSHLDSAITITRFTNSILGIDMTYNNLLAYYAHEISKNTTVNPKPDLVESTFNLTGPNGLNTPYFYFEHLSEIRTYVVKLNDTSILRIRCRTNKIPNILDFIEFYE